MMRVEILIDELVLHGFSPSDQQAIGAALALELQQRLARGGPEVLTRLQNTASLAAGQISLPPGAKPAAIGAQIAGAVHGSLVPQKPRGLK
jgi:hypothetical protein